MRKICKNCRLAKWQRTANGRVNSHYAGECEFDLGIIRLPVCATGPISPQPRKSGILYSDQRICPVFIPKQEKQRNATK